MLAQQTLEIAVPQNPTHNLPSRPNNGQFAPVFADHTLRFPARIGLELERHGVGTDERAPPHDSKRFAFTNSRADDAFLEAHDFQKSE
jgi:hypothetical protein